VVRTGRLTAADVVRPESPAPVEGGPPQPISKTQSAPRARRGARR